MKKEAAEQGRLDILSNAVDIPDHAGSEDFTGRDRIMKNVFASWAGHLVFVIAGFVMPRLIDRSVGQAALGVWDFAWSLVSYFGLAGLGIGSSVNRYVAKYRAVGDEKSMCEIVSSAMAVQFATAVLVAILSISLAIALPRIFSGRLGDQIEIARWVVALLGSGLAIQMGFDAFRGVITGCHRWDLHNAINAGSYGVTVIGMIVALSMGGGLKSLGVVNLVSVAVTEILRSRVAHRVCPELKVRISFVNRGDIKKVFKYGGKSVVAGLPPLLLVQGSSLLVASYLGPAALAVFSRPNGLIRSVQTFLNKFAFVLTPTAGSLQSSGQNEEIRRLVTQATLVSVSLALPIVLLLSIQGDLILRIWMGPRYEMGALLTVLAVGYFIPLTQQPAITILSGMNQHGKIGIVGISIATAGIAIGSGLALFYGLGLFHASLLVAIPMAINGVFVAVHVCRKMNIPLGVYVKETFWRPTICCVPFAGCLFIGRLVFTASPALVLGAGCFSGSILLGLLYWRFVLPGEARSRIEDYVKYRGASSSFRGTDFNG